MFNLVLSILMSAAAMCADQWKTNVSRVCDAACGSQLKMSLWLMELDSRRPTRTIPLPLPSSTPQGSNMTLSWMPSPFFLFLLGLVSLFFVVLVVATCLFMGRGQVLVPLTEQLLDETRKSADHLADVRRLEEELQVANDTISDERATNLTLQSQVETATTTIANLEEDLDAQEKLYETRSNEIRQNASVERDTLRSRSKDEIDELSRKNKGLEEDMKRLSEELTEAKQGEQKQAGEVDNLRQKLADAMKRHTEEVRLLEQKPAEAAEPRAAPEAAVSIARDVVAQGITEPGHRLTEAQAPAEVEKVEAIGAAIGELEKEERKEGEGEEKEAKKKKKCRRGKRGSKKEKVELHTEDQAPASDMEEVGDVPVEKVAAATQGSSKAAVEPLVASNAKRQVPVVRVRLPPIRPKVFVAAPVPVPIPTPAPAPIPPKAFVAASAPARHQPSRPRADERLLAWANFGAVAEKNEAEAAQLAKERRDDGQEFELPAMNETWRQVGDSREKRTIIGVSKSRPATKLPISSPETSKDPSNPRKGVAGSKWAPKP